MESSRWSLSIVSLISLIGRRFTVSVIPLYLILVHILIIERSKVARFACSRSGLTARTSKQIIFKIWHHDHRSKALLKLHRSVHSHRQNVNHNGRRDPLLNSAGAKFNAVERSIDQPIQWQLLHLRSRRCAEERRRRSVPSMIVGTVEDLERRAVGSMMDSTVDMLLWEVHRAGYYHPLSATTSSQQQCDDSCCSVVVLGEPAALFVVVRA